MSSDRFLLLLTKQLAGTLTAEEETELKALLADEENAAAAEALTRFWQAKDAAPQPATETALAKVLATISNEAITVPATTPATPVRRLGRWRWAAAAAVVVALGYLVLQKQLQPNPLSYNKPIEPVTTGAVAEKQNAKGTRSIITLADGTKVWLNADSKLQYPLAFEGGTREVSLSGEAFFDVAKNREKPFIIHLKAGTVRVLGTSFNVKAYDNSPVVETSVATGRVAFIPKNKKADTVFLTHDLKAVYSVQRDEVQTVHTSSNMDKAWTEGKLLFDNTSMEEIATTLERTFGKQVIINDDELRAYHFSGPFENDRLEEILYYLSKSKPFTYRITETQVILSAVR